MSSGSASIGNSTASTVTHYQNAKRKFNQAMLRLSSNDRNKPIGSSPAANISISESMKSQITMAQASKTNLKLSSTFVSVEISGYQIIKDFLVRMGDLSGQLIGNNHPETFESLQLEFTAFQDGLKHFSHSLYNEKHTLSKDVILSFNANNDSQTLRHWDQEGRNESSFKGRLGDVTNLTLQSSPNPPINLKDANGQEIGFSSTRSFTLDNTGENLFFIGYSTSKDQYTIRRYNLESNTVYTGMELGAGDAYREQLYVDASGNLWTSDDGQLKSISTNTLETSVTYDLNGYEILSGTNYAVADRSYYLENTLIDTEVITFIDSTDNEIVVFDLNTNAVYDPTGSAPIQLDPKTNSADITYTDTTVDNTAFGSALDSSNFIVANAGFRYTSFSPSGKFAADAYGSTTTGPITTIRIISTDNSPGQYNGLHIDMTSLDPNATVGEIALNQDADRLYYTDTTNNSIKYIAFKQNIDGTFLYEAPVIAVEAQNNSSIQGLSLGGGNPNSNYSTSAWEGSLVTTDYSALDLTLRGLGLLDINLYNIENVHVANSAIQTAAEKATQELSKAVAAFTSLEFQLESVTNFEYASSQTLEIIRKPDQVLESAAIAEATMQTQTAMTLIGKYNQLQIQALSLLNHL